MAGRPNNTLDSTRALQHKLYLAAKRSPNRRFHALFDRVFRKDVLRCAWLEVRANQGAPGVDATTIADIEAAGVGGFLDGLAVSLREGSYRPQPVRRVWIPKPGKPGKMRPLGVASVRDRVVQQAVKIVLEPIVEADFLPCSFGFRPKRSAHQALQAMREAVRGGRTWVVDADIDSFFDRLDRDLVLDCLRERVSDRRLLKLIRAILSAGVLDGVVLSAPVQGVPQGGPLSPVLANVVLHRLDRVWEQRHRRLGGARTLRRRRVHLLPYPGAGRGGAGRSRADPGRARAVIGSRQDADRPRRRWDRRLRLPGLPPSDGALAA